MNEEEYPVSALRAEMKLFVWKPVREGFGRIADFRGAKLLVGAIVLASGFAWRLRRKKVREEKR